MFKCFTPFVLLCHLIFEARCQSFVHCTFICDYIFIQNIFVCAMNAGLASLLWDSEVFAAPSDDALPLPLPVAPPPAPTATHVTLPPRADLWHVYGLDADDDADGGGGGQAASFGCHAIAAPGVIAIEDDNDDDDVIVVITRDPPWFCAGLTPDPSPLYAASPLAFWVRQIGDAMEKAVCDVERIGSQVRWQLPPTLGQSIVDWAVAHINDAIAQGEVHSFYIGLTSLVFARWRGRKQPPVMVGHCMKGWHRMTLLAVSDQAGVIGHAEKSVIAQFRHLGPRGRDLGSRVVDGRRVAGDLRCENKNPGGEGARGGVPPHMLYVCMRWVLPEDVERRRRSGLLMHRD